MGYVSLSEDNSAKFYDYLSMIDKSSVAVFSDNKLENDNFTKEVKNDEPQSKLKIAEQELINTNKRIKNLEANNSKTETEIELLKKEIAELKILKNKFLIKLNEKENLLTLLKKEIRNILDKNEINIKTIENRNDEIMQNSLNNLNRENADQIMNLLSEVRKINGIIHRQNFHKEMDSIKKLKAIVKNILGS